MDLVCLESGGLQVLKSLKDVWGDLGSLGKVRLWGENECRGRARCCHLSKGQRDSVEKINI